MMIDLKEVYNEVILTESKAKHIFSDGGMTFAELRDIFASLFKDGGTVLSKKVPGMSILVTFKDGEFCVATDFKQLKKPCCISKISDRCCDAGKNVKTAFMNSLKDLTTALQSLDPVLLNKYFANGQNFMDCQVVFPPEDTCSCYGDKCFLTFNKLKCFDSNFKEIGEDVESAKDLFDMLKQNTDLSKEVEEISDPNIKLMRGCCSGKEVLEKIDSKLKEFIDGVGWGCSLDSYIQDKYSRYIINKALEHGLDVSRNSAFVNELVSRLSGTKTKLRPSKSDLMTFAKREGLNCHSDEYKMFLNDLEANADQTSSEIIAPLEDLIYFGVVAALKNIIGYMALDPNAKTQKFIGSLDLDACGLNEADGECKFCKDKLEPLKKNLLKVNQYVEMLPRDGVVLLWKAQPYKVFSKLGKLESLCKVICK